MAAFLLWAISSGDAIVTTAKEGVLTANRFFYDPVTYSVIIIIAASALCIQFGSDAVSTAAKRRPMASALFQQDAVAAFVVRSKRRPLVVRATAEYGVQTVQFVAALEIWSCNRQRAYWYLTQSCWRSCIHLYVHVHVGTEDIHVHVHDCC